MYLRLSISRWREKIGAIDSFTTERQQKEYLYIATKNDNVNDKMENDSQIKISHLGMREDISQSLISLLIQEE